MTNRAETRGMTYRNVVLTAICGLLAVLAMRDPSAMPSNAAIAAQPTMPVGMDAGAQRQEMIASLKELKTITEKLSSIEKSVGGRLDAIDATVTDMAVMLKRQQQQQQQRGSEGKKE